MYDYAYLLYYLLENSSTKVSKDAGIVKRVYQRLKFNKTNKKKLLLNAFKFNFIELIRLLLTEIKNNTEIRKLLNNKIRIAFINDDVEMVELLLTDSKKRINPRDWLFNES